MISPRLNMILLFDGLANGNFLLLNKDGEMQMNMKDFEIMKDIGTGSFGRVQLVRKRDDQQLYAMKSVSLSRLPLKDKENALNEVRLLASIHIPNVISYYGAFFHAETQSLCVLLEYAEGGDLQQLLLQRENQSEEEAQGLDQCFVLKVAHEILQGLKVLHRNKIVHRDLKSANIFFVKGVAKIGDLNVSKLTENGLCSTQTGTPYYTSPQIWKGEKYGSKCDIWSTGCLIYEMCALKHPFKATDFPALYRKITAGIYPDISDKYSSRVKYLINMCLTVDQEMRPSAEQLLQHKVFQNIQETIANLDQGNVKIVGKIKCPKVLRFLNSRLPQPYGEEIKKVVFSKKSVTKEPSSNKENKVKKIKSEKNLSKREDCSKKSFDFKNSNRIGVADSKSRERKGKTFSLKKIKKVGSSKNLANLSIEFRKSPVTLKKTAV